MSVLAYNFSIVGVQKAGTTTLAWALRQHPDVCRPPRKEIHFFDDEDYDWDDPRYERDYTAPRRAARHQMMGDATPTYLFWPHALERMHAYEPDLPLIAIFRDPLERLFSHWAHLRARVMPWIDWPKFITRFAETSLPAELPSRVPPVRYGQMAGIARGYYGQQLQRGFDIFPRDQWLLLEFREMFADFEGTLDAATDHLGLARFQAHPPSSQRNAGDAGVTGTPPTGEQLKRIAELYADDLELFADLSGLDTTAWPTRRILEGALDPEELARRFAAKINRESQEPPSA